MCCAPDRVSQAVACSAEEEGAQGLAFRRAAREGACGTNLKADGTCTYLPPNTF